MLRESARWTTIHSPDARTSHLRTLSKILGTGLSALFRPRHRSARGSRTLYSSFRERQHLSANLSAASRFVRTAFLAKRPSNRAAHLTASFRFVNHPSKPTAVPRSVRPHHPSSGPRILQLRFSSSTLTETAVFRAPYKRSSACRAAHLTACFRFVNTRRKPLFLRVPAGVELPAGRASYSMFSIRQYVSNPPPSARPADRTKRRWEPPIMRR